jgi:hypothetical protein
MKKITLLLLALVAGTSLWAENVKINGIYYSLSSTTAQVISDQSSDKSVYTPYTSVTIPASVTYNNYTYPVTYIGTSAFEGCSNLESVVLPSSVTSIGTDAFYGCVRLERVNLEEGLTNINLRAFYNCKLDTIVIPSTVTSIGNGAFKGNPTKSIVWKPKTCSIGSDDSAPFYSTSSQVTSFVFGDSIQVIPAYLCENMNLLDTIVLPSTLTTIGAYSFKNCFALKGIQLPEGAIYMGDGAFMYCTSLKSFAFPEGKKSLPVSVLEGCTALEEVFIPSSVTTINQDAFYNCSSLRAIHNLAFTPQTITERAVYNVNKQTCILYVPMDYIDLYRAKAVWCDFLNIIGVATDLQFEDQLITVTYLKADADHSPHYMESQHWQVPHAPRIEGFTFLRWEVQSGDLADGIFLQAVYQANEPTSAPAVYTNPANPAQKLIRNGAVYILSDDQLYTIDGKLAR